MLNNNNINNISRCKTTSNQVMNARFVRVCERGRIGRQVEAMSPRLAVRRRRRLKACRPTAPTTQGG